MRRYGLSLAPVRVFALATFVMLGAACSSAPAGDDPGGPAAGEADGDAGAPFAAPSAPAADGGAPATASQIHVRAVSKVEDVPRGQPAAGSYRVHLIDVGTGLSLLVQGHDFNLLFDGGSNDDKGAISSTGNKNRLVAYLFAALGPSGPAACTPDGDAWTKGKDLPRVKLDHLFLSHPHNDHVSMLDDVLQCFQAANVWDPGVAYQTTAYRSFLQSFADDKEIRFHTATAPPSDKTVTINAEAVTVQGAWTKFDDGKTDNPLGEGASFKILHADGASYEDANQNSTVLSVKLGDKKLLLMGDAESGDRLDPSAPVGYVEKFLLQVYPSELKSDILQVAHHGSKTSSRLAFLKAVAPSIALLSSGPTKYSGVQLPDPEVVSAITGLSPNLQLLRTDTHDAKCPTADRIGYDDTAPGGCDNYVLDIGP